MSLQWRLKLQLLTQAREKITIANHEDILKEMFMKNTNVTQWLLCALGLWLLSQCCGHCFYDPALQRWINRDPLGDLGFENVRRVSIAKNSRRLSHEVLIGGLNSYTFVKNAPSDNADNFGLIASSFPLGPQPPTAPNPNPNPSPCGPPPVGPCWPIPCGLSGIDDLVYCVIRCALGGRGVPVGRPICLLCFPPGGPAVIAIGCPCSGGFKK
jgi:hypothetical protein